MFEALFFIAFIFAFLTIKNVIISAVTKIARPTR